MGIPGWQPALAVALGGAIGSVARWRVGAWLNPLAQPLALGTLAANCLGGLLIGAALVWFERRPDETLRLLWITGVLGGFTTFSAFSGESLALLVRGQLAWAAAHMLAHVLGALGCCALGWRLARALLA